MKISVGITPDEVKIAIAEYLMNHISDAKCDPKDVKLEINRVASGQGMNETSTYQFTGATANLGEAE